MNSYYRGNIDFGNGIIYELIGNDDGIIITYDENGNTKKVERVAEVTNPHGISELKATSDNGYIALLDFSSVTKDFGNGVKLYARFSDGVLVKYNEEGLAEWGLVIGEDTKQDYLNSVDELTSGQYIVGGQTKLWQGNSEEYKGMVLRIASEMGTPEISEITLENQIKEYVISTDVNKIDGIKGGSISGENQKKYEVVKYDETSTKEIKMIPDENYEIISITVNGEEYPFEKEADGSFTMPQFEHMMEDKHVVVTYSLKDNKITINKVDSISRETIPDVTFRLDQLEERPTPINADIIGDLTGNGQEYVYSNPIEEVTENVLGDLTSNNTYYFVEQEGKYYPTNSKTYQIANGGTAGIQSVTANSYIPIDLTDLDGTYAIVVNAEVSSENSYDYGYATITESTSAPSYSTTTNRFMYICGTQAAKDYTSNVIEGGKTYYLHLGYRKDGSGDTGADQVIINSVKLYSATEIRETFNFVENGGKYISSNQGKDNTVSNSYIPIDLTEYVGKYNLIVNANVSSQSDYDYGYATITENTTRPAYNTGTGRFIFISGTQSAKDYNTVLQGGKLYYLHLGYYKNINNSSGYDQFVVNSVRIELNDSELYHTQVITNSEGKGITQIPFGKYAITEVNTPEGFWPNEEPIVVEFRSFDGAQHEFTIENEKQAKVIVHHYIKGTEEKLADDEETLGRIGTVYTTSPKLDLQRYTLEKDENDEFILPINATGNYTYEDTEVTYYYVERAIPLTVHHYIEGTENRVPLADGTVAEDIRDQGQRGTAYETSEIEDSLLDERYELASIPGNANGTYGEDEVIVTYYYKEVEREVIINKLDEDGETKLQNAEFTLTNPNNIIVVGDMTNNGTYYMEKQGNKYVSNNQGKHGYTANSYIRVDMTMATVPSIVTANVQISSESGYDYGYATVTENGTAPSYSDTAGRFIFTSGTYGAKDYTTTLAPGKVYYIHFGYRKDGSVNSGTDTFTINSINIEGGGQSYTTNENGQIVLRLKPGEYVLTEITPPADHVLPENPSTNIAVSKSSGVQEITITNEKVKGDVIVHYYIEGTTTRVPSQEEGEVVQDIIKRDKIGTPYATMPAPNVSENYELVAMPENSSGPIVAETTEVIYYYRLKPGKVIVHHYIKGTETSVADDEELNGLATQSYTTNPHYDLEKYELEKDENNQDILPINQNGTYSIEDTIVIYNYVKKRGTVTVHHLIEGTTDNITLANGTEVLPVTTEKEIDEEYRSSPMPDNRYKLSITADNPNGIYIDGHIDVYYYYVLNEKQYSVEYYYSNVKDEDATETYNSTFGEVISTYEDKLLDGHVLYKTEKLPLTVGNDESANVIKIYYVPDSSLVKPLTYRVEYYINGEIQPDDTVTVTREAQILAPNVLTVITAGINKKDKYPGCKYEKMELNEDRVFYIPEVVNSGDVIKIYYVTDPDQKTEVTYKVEYYKDNVLQGSDTQTERKLVQVLEEKVLEVNKDNINITDKYPGYTFDKTDPEELPEIVADGSTIKVYYVKTKYPYSVEYYYNNEIDEDLTEHGEAYKDDTIEEYTNKPKEGYEFDSVDKVPLVISDTEPNVIKVYYLPIRKITVNHIDKNDETNILETEEKEGKEGSTITTEAKDFEEYILVEKPETEEYTFTEEEQVVNYYYAKVSSGVIEKHIDIISGKPVADSTLYDGYEGKEYETSHLEEIEGYEIATNKEYYEMIVLKENPNFLEENEVQTLEEYFELKEINAEDPYIPENAKGEMTDELIEVKYYYTPKVKLIVKYVDILTDLEIPEKVDEELIDSTVTKEGKIGDHYQTEAKEFDGYVLESVPENAEGEYKITLNDDGTYTKEIVVTYYYIVEREVIVRYYDKISGEEISTETVKIGPDGEAYDLSTEQKEIEGYTLVEVPENPTGVYQEENETRKFYYAKNTQVVVKYVDEDTGEVINDSDNYTINGYIGKEYESEKKEFSGYEYTKDTENTKGEMEKDTIEVIYYYKKLPKETVVNQPTTTETSVTTNNNNTNTSTITPTIKTETTTKSSTKTTKASTNTTKATNTKNNTEKKETKIVPPNTGDKTPIVAIEVIVIVVIANIIQIALMKKKINKGHHVR